MANRVTIAPDKLSKSAMKSASRHDDVERQH
jgi:hypothetical protein